MALRLTWTTYGRPAGEALACAVAEAKGGNPLAPVTVIVPSNHVGVGARRLLASGKLGSVAPSGTGIAAVTFLTVYRLAELLGAQSLAASQRRPVSTPVIAAALRRALRDDPGAFAAVADHPATESALVEAYRELRDLSPEAMQALSRQSRRAADVVRLHAAARQILETSFYDEQDLTVAAVDALAAGALAEPVVVHLPQRISRHGGLLIAALAKACDVQVIAATTGRARADAEVKAALGRIGVEPEAPTVAAAGLPTGNTTFVTCSDADDEVRAAVRAVVEAARANTPLDRIAILHASPDPYARLVHEHLSAAGIKANGAAVVPLAARAAGRMLLGLIDLHEQQFRREDVFAWLSGAPVLVDGKWAPVMAWERLSRDAGVTGGRNQWDEHLDALAKELDEAAAEAAADPDAPEWRSQRAAEAATRARQLRTFVLRLIDDLADACGRQKPWSEHARWARRHLDELLGRVHRRADWPHAEAKAGEKVEQALERLAALDEVEPATSLDVFARTLALELEADLGRVGRLGEGVLVGTIGMGVGLDLDLVIVLGLAEGGFPARVREDSLIPDAEREACGDQLPLRRSLVDRQHRELLASLAGATQRMLVVPRGDLRRSAERVPSRFVLELASEIKGERWWSKEFLSAQEPWIHHVPSYDAGLRGCSFPATQQEHRLKASIADGRSPAEVAAADEVIKARRSHKLSRFDGNLSALTGEIPTPAERVTSPTRLERWTSCPFAYLLENVLGVQPVENPEDEIRITAMDWGNVIHEVLDRFIAEVLHRPAHEQPSPDDGWSLQDRARVREISEEVCKAYEERGRTGREIFWKRDRSKIEADLMRILDYDELHRTRARTRPIATELPFGLRDAAVEAVPVPLPDGRTVRFRGKADRVDLAEDGTIHVVDYKTGRPYGAEKLCEDDPDRGGTKLQLPVYGLAARAAQTAPDAAVRAEYWFVSDKGKWKRYGYEVTDAVLAHFGQTLARVVDGIEAGLFAHHPSSDSSSWGGRVDCPYCDPDGLGVVELRKAWDRKRHDPLLSTYADVVEPLPS
jgi:ATP-dependent helicase/nuclease subunit B